MSIKRLTTFFTDVYTNPWGHTILLTIYYLAIIAGLIALYGKGNFSTPKFVYQGF
jgi:hypothetical protein